MEMCGIQQKIEIDEKYLEFLEFLFFFSQQFGLNGENIT